MTPGGEPSEAGQATVDREQAESLERLESGQLPLGAERRLDRLREEGGLFTSDLSIPEFSLARQSGLQPLTQVMGSCVYQVGWQYASEAINSWGRVVFQEMEAITEAWNEARRRALSRIRKEALLAQADAVVGVRFQTGRYDWAADSVELMVFGTAVRDPASSRNGDALLSDLSMQDYWKLRQAGVEPCGLVAATACFFVVRGAWSRQMQALTFNVNQEETEYTEGVYQARETALDRVTDQIRSAGGDGVVGMQISHTISRQDLKVSRGGSAVSGLVATFHAVGTAVRMPRDVAVHPPETTIPLSLTKERR